jgi:hypothetical protein
MPALYCPGGRALFTKKEDGRTKEPRGTFFGYVAVSQPPKSNADAAAPKTTTGAAAAEQGQDLAIVWRGTIFKEEWESNFAQDQLVRLLNVTPHPMAAAASC